MFKNFKKNDKYFTIAVYAFLCVCAILALVLLVLNLGKIFGFLGSLLSAMASFIYGFVIAYICNPVYKFLHKKAFAFVEKKKPHHILRKTFSMIVTYIIFFGAIALIMLAIIPSLISNLSNLSNRFQEYYNNIVEWYENLLLQIKESFPSFQVNDVYNQLFPADGGALKTVVDFISTNLLDFGTTTISQVIAFIVGIILSIYFLSYKDSIIAKCKKTLCALLPKDRYLGFMKFARYTDETFGHYLIGAIMDSVMVGCVVGIIVRLVFPDMPFAALIGAIVGVTNIIPFFGPFLGGIPSGLLILIAGKPYQVLIFALIIVIVQQIDGNIIAPHILGNATKLTPIGIIAAVTVCAHWFGIVGMVIGVPLTAVVSYLVKEFVNSRLKKKRLPISLDRYYAKDLYEDENFIQACNEAEAQYRVERIESFEKAKEEHLSNETQIVQAEEKIINDKNS